MVGHGKGSGLACCLPEGLLHVRAPRWLTVECSWALAKAHAPQPAGCTPLQGPSPHLLSVPVCVLYSLMVSSSEADTSRSSVR